MRVAGIDPGLSGAIAIYDDELVLPVTVSDTPTVEVVKNKKHKHDYVIAEMVRILREARPNMAILEKVGAMPGQGVTSMFSFGRGLGIWEGVLAGLGIPYTLVPPQTWKKVMMGGSNPDKSQAIIRATQLFPELSADIHLKKHDGRAEAVLMAAYGAKVEQAAKGVS